MKINRREAIIVGAAASFLPVLGSPSFADGVHDWAKIAARQFAQYGVLPVLNEHDDLTKPGAKLTRPEIHGHKLFQRHVDWWEPKDGSHRLDPTAPIGALVTSVFHEIYPSNELKTFTLFTPSHGDVAKLSYGHLKLRVLREEMAMYTDLGEEIPGYATRVDFLFLKKAA